MTDDALISWLKDGAPPSLSVAEAAARERSAFVLRFSQALKPESELGVTEEEHEAAVARNVYAVHADLCTRGIDEYDAVWMQIGASDRAALKAYIKQARTSK